MIFFIRIGIWRNFFPPNRNLDGKNLVFRMLIQIHFWTIFQNTQIPSKTHKNTVFLVCFLIKNLHSPQHSIVHTKNTTKKQQKYKVASTKTTTSPTISSSTKQHTNLVIFKYTYTQPTVTADHYNRHIQQTPTKPTEVKSF